MAGKRKRQKTKREKGSQTGLKYIHFREKELQNASGTFASEMDIQNTMGGWGGQLEEEHFTRSQAESNGPKCMSQQRPKLVGTRPNRESWDLST